MFILRFFTAVDERDWKKRFAPGRDHPANMNLFSYVVPAYAQRMLFGWATVGKLVGPTVSLLLGFMSARRSLPTNLQRQANSGPTQFFVLASRV